MTTGLETPAWAVSSRGHRAHRLYDGRAVCGRVPDGARWTPAAGTEPTCTRCSTLGADTVTHQAFVDAGLSYRQLDHWTRVGYLRPSHPGRGSGSVRAFPRSELAVARVMLRLTAAGVTPDAAHRVARGGQLAPGIHLHIEDAHLPTEDMLDDLAAFRGWIAGIAAKAAAQQNLTTSDTVMAVLRELDNVLARRPLAYACTGATDTRVVDWLIAHGHLAPEDAR